MSCECCQDRDSLLGKADKLPLPILVEIVESRNCVVISKDHELEFALSVFQSLIEKLNKP